MRNPFAHRADAPIGLITITVMLGLIMAIIDSTIVNVALNTIGGNLGASIDEVAWVATGYILANVIVMPLNGWLTAPSSGASAFTLLRWPSSRLRRSCAERRRTSSAAGVLSRDSRHRRRRAAADRASDHVRDVSAGETRQGDGDLRPRRDGRPAIGPTLGGYIVDNASWPLIFYINIPIGIVAFFMTLAFIPKPKYIERSKARHRLDRARAADRRPCIAAVRARTRRTRRLVRLVDDRQS